MLERIDEVKALPAAPLCLAGTQLVLNRGRARLAEVAVRMAECERSLEVWMRETCLDHEQIRRGEIWIFDREHRIPHVFVAGGEAASWHDAVAECASRKLALGAAGHEARIVSSRQIPKITLCLSKRGWTPISALNTSRVRR